MTTKYFHYALIAILLVCSACRSDQIGRVDLLYNVVNTSLDYKADSYKDLEDSIQKAGFSLGWRMVKKSKGVMLGNINIRGKHHATVKITYRLKSFDITYVNSVNLRYQAETNTIHSNYNNWVRALEQAIVNETYQAATLKDN